MTQEAAAREVVAQWSLAWPAALPQRSATEQSALNARAVRAVIALQTAARQMSGPGRALHHRCLYATEHATFAVADDVAEPIALGPLRPSAVWTATLRISSAYPVARADDVPDQRGLAVRLTNGDRRIDLLATTGEAHHARDALAMIASLEAAARATSSGIAGKTSALLHLVRRLGVRDGLALARAVGAAAKAGVSLSSLTYYSRAPFQLGPHAVRYRFQPIQPVAAALTAKGQHALAADLSARTREGEGSVSWAFQLQGFVDAARTPLDDHRVAWQSPWITVARLSLPSSAQGSGSAEDGCEGGVTAFDVVPHWPDARGAVFVPLGDLNALRAAGYAASAAGRAQRS